MSPNVCKLINLSNKFTYWYAKCIVDTLNFDERCKVMQRILDIAGYFNEMNNFSGLKEIYAALETSSVRRLLATRSKINLESQEIYKIFVKLFDNHDNGYFERLKKCNPPCIPFIGIHLTIILKTYEFNKIYDDRQRQHITYLQVSSCVWNGQHGPFVKQLSVEINLNNWNSLTVVGLRTWYFKIFHYNNSSKSDFV